MRHFNLAKNGFLRIVSAFGFLVIFSAISANAQGLETKSIDLKNCIPTYLEKSFVIEDRETFLKTIRNDARRNFCLENLEKIDFDKYTLIGIELNTGYCRTPLLLPTEVLKKEAEKQYLVKISYIEPQTPCRARSQYDFWILVPKLPKDYTVEFKVEGKSSSEVKR